MSPLPQPIRKDNVLEKLEYAEEQRNELNKALFGSYETDELPKFVSMRAEGVLTNARECFDYLAHDLIEGYLIPTAPAKFVASYKSGKEKTYFPFYAGQLTQPRWPWHQFKTVEKTVFDNLKGFIDAIDQHQFLGNTSSDARYFRVVQEMVNEKKHSKVTHYEAVAEAAVFHKGPMGSILLDKVTAAIPGLTVGSGFGGGEPKLVPAFRFSANGCDVPDLCLFAVSATRTVMDWFYETFFQPTGHRIDTSGPMMVNGIPVERPMWMYQSQ
jgi:hypothetical protein